MSKLSGFLRCKPEEQIGIGVKGVRLLEVIIALRDLVNFYQRINVKIYPNEQMCYKVYCYSLHFFVFNKKGMRQQIGKTCCNVQCFWMKSLSCILSIIWYKVLIVAEIKNLL